LQPGLSLAVNVANGAGGDDYAPVFPVVERHSKQGIALYPADREPSQRQCLMLTTYV